MKFSKSLSNKPIPIKRFDKLASGVIDEAVEGDTRGRIRCFATFWFALPYPGFLNLTFSKGDKVLVVARQGNTLLILPNDSQHKALAMKGGALPCLNPT